MAEIAAATKTAAPAKAVPTAKAIAATVTIGISTRSGSRYSGFRQGCRTRNRAREKDEIRVAVTYRLEEENGPADEAELARLIRLGVREVRRAYRLACTPAARRDNSAPLPERATVACVSEKPTPLAANADSVPGQEVAVKTEPNCPDCSDCPAPDSAVSNHEKEEITFRRLTRTQRSTLDVMARQLDLTGAALLQLLGMRCNRKSLDDLSYREAAALIAHFSRLLRQRLQQERENKKLPSQTKGEKPLPERA